MRQKTCTKCKISKEIFNFKKRKSRSKKETKSYTHESWCKQCKIEYTNNWRTKNRFRPIIKFPSTKKCSRCKIIKPTEAFSRSFSNINGLYSACKKCIAKYDAMPHQRARRCKNVKKWHQTPEGYRIKINHNRNRRDRERLLNSTWNTQKEKFILNKYNYKCLICKTNKDITIDHLFPLSNGYPLNILNAIPLCKTCNSKKCNKTPYNFLEKDMINNRFNLKEFQIKECQINDIIKQIGSLHYLSSMPPAPKHIYGLTLYNDIIGLCIFGTPSRQNIKADLELSRFFVMDGTPKNTESYFLGNSLKLLKKSGFTGTIISFADTTEGHTGTIYKASNWKFNGMTTPNYHYETIDGIRIHKKQVWNRAKYNGIKETQQAELEALIKVDELPKSRWMYTI